MASCLAIPIYAQTVTIFDATDNVPLSHVSATIVNRTGTTQFTSNERGEITFSGLQPSDSILFNHEESNLTLFTGAQLQQQNYRIKLDRKVVNLNELVISVNKEPDPREHTPYYVNVIDKKQIENSNSATTADLLQINGNVAVQKSQLGGGSPIIRGFEASRVLMVVDGIRMNNAIFRAGHLQNILRIDQNTLDRTEVMFGPGSVMYGSDALGGTMYFKTKSPVLSTTDKIFFSGNAMLRYGSADFEKTGHVDFNIAGRKFGSFTSITFTDFDDRMQGQNGGVDGDTLWTRDWYVERINNKDSIFVNPNRNKQVQTGFWQVNAMQKFLFAPNASDRHTINFQYTTTSDVFRYDRLTETSGGLPKFAEWHYGPETWVLGSYRFEHTDARWKYAITAGYQFIRESRNNRRLNNAIRKTQDENVHVASLNADVSRLIGKHELKFGVEGTFNNVLSSAYRRNVDTDSITGPADTRYPGGGSFYYTAAAYIHDTWLIHHKVNLAMGVRFNYAGLNATFNDTTFFPFPYTQAIQNNFAVNGHLGVIYSPGSDWKFSLMASTGFRSPNVDDLTKVFESVPGQIIVPNPNILPEYSINGEINITKTFFKCIRVEAVAFGSYVPNLMTSQPYTLNGSDSILYDGQMSAVYAMQNTDNGFILGCNINVLANITPYFAMSSSLNYTYGRVISSSGTEAPLDHIAPMYGRTAAMLNYKKWYGEMSVLYSAGKNLADYSPSGEDNLQYATPYGMPGWYTLNAKLGYSVNRYIRIQLAADNITDVKYRTFGSGLTAPGRNFIVTLRSSF